MNGTCTGCGDEHPVQEFSGYNVRHGKVTDAVCPSCAMFYLDFTKREYRRPDWFSLALQRIMGAKQKLPLGDNVTDIRGRRLQ